MATKHQTRPRPMGQANIPKSRKKRVISQSVPPIITNNSKDVKIRFGNNHSQNSMYKPTPILKKRRQELPYNENFIDGYQPSNLDLIQSRPFYSPIRTPPRLRRLITSPGLEPYRNTHNLRQLHSPLPTLDGLYSHPIGLNTWGLDPTDYHISSNMNLMRRYPSPLSHFGFASALPKQMKPYFVVPHLNNLVSPPGSSGGDGVFTLPTRRTAPAHIQDSQQSYLDRLHSFSTPRFHSEPIGYGYIQQNEAFANRYIEDYIGLCIEDQFIPDILLEIIGELEHENEKPGGKGHNHNLDRYYEDLYNRINRQRIDNTHLYSDDWVRELDHQRPMPLSNVDSNLPVHNSLDSSHVPPVKKTKRLRYHDLPPDAQKRLLADINQEFVDLEVENMASELSNQAFADRFHNTPIMNDTTHHHHHHIEPEVVHETKHDQRDQVQHNSIEQYAQNKLLDTICLDQLLVKHIKQHGSIVDVDDLSRLLDATILENLIYQSQDIDENRSRTTDNYAAKKFHLNTFMNITMDLLLTELSASLIEDIKDLDEQERRKF